MIHEPTTEVANNHPPEMSASPYNSYYLSNCQIVERQAPYASCLNKIHEFEAGRSTALSPECTEAIGRKQCEAVGMRDQEKLQGVALFYYPSTFWRNKQISNLTPADELPKTLAGPTKLPFVSADPRAANFKDRYREYQPPHPPKKTDLSLPACAPMPALTFKTIALPDHEDGYAAAINAAMQTAVTPEPKPAATRMACAGPSSGDMPVDRLISALPLPISAPLKTPPGRPPMQVGETPLQYARRVAASR